uniref:Uncharacterized protein n=1 Tax=Arundo donax TaxID=35708 RepID=A0A0A8ZJU1_ARUDO
MWMMVKMKHHLSSEGCRSTWLWWSFLWTLVAIEQQFNALHITALIDEA